MKYSARLSTSLAHDITIPVEAYNGGDYQPFFHPMTDTNGAILAKLADLEKRIEKMEVYFSPSDRSISSHPYDADHDSLFPDAVKLLAGLETASASLFQRRLKVGYARAARILDELHDAGYVGPPLGSLPRIVLKKPI